jgi:serine/threonine protein kinase
MNNRDMYIVTEYFSKGNLKEYLTNLKKLYKNEITYSFFWDIIFQMIVPVNFLHKLGYIHSDIKPTNYLIMDNNQLLLNDFCLSIKERELKTNELEGDSIYISPELFYKNVGTISHKSDIYSLGLSILELLIDEDLPKNGQVWQEMRNQGIPSHFFDKIILINNDFVQKCKLIELIKDMTKINSDERPELDIFLNDVIKYPELYNRFEKLKKRQYEKNIFINIDNINTRNILLDDNKEENFKNVNTEININKIFYKRSNSMENLL